jgi:hypothetical protein
MYKVDANNKKIEPMEAGRPVILENMSGILLYTKYLEMATGFLKTLALLEP